MEQLRIRDSIRGIARRIARPRNASRLKNELPILMDFGGSGVTRDISPSGVFFETDAAYTVGSTVHFAIEIVSIAGQMRMECSGTIVRLEKQATKVGVAVKFHSQRLKSAAG